MILLEAGNRFIPNTDRDIAESMLDSLKRKHIEVRLNVHSQSVFDTADGITLTYTNGSDGTPYFVEGDALLLATGRRPRTDELDLHAAGIQTDARGAIIVNEQLHTTSPHIWALGDVGEEHCSTICLLMIIASSVTNCSVTKSDVLMTVHRFLSPFSQILHWHM